MKITLKRTICGMNGRQELLDVKGGKWGAPVKLLVGKSYDYIEISLSDIYEKEDVMDEYNLPHYGF